MKESKEINEFSNLIKEILNPDSDEYTSEEQVPAKFRLAVQPAITRKSAELRQKAKRQKENMLFIAGYVVFLFLAILFTANCIFGYSETLIKFSIIAFGILSLLMLSCLPLLIVFKDNIFERRIH